MSDLTYRAGHLLKLGTHLSTSCDAHNCRHRVRITCNTPFEGYATGYWVDGTVGWGYANCIKGRWYISFDPYEYIFGPNVPCGELITGSACNKYLTWYGLAAGSEKTTGGPFLCDADSFPCYPLSDLQPVDGASNPNGMIQVAIWNNAGKLRIVATIGVVMAVGPGVPAFGYSFHATSEAEMDTCDLPKEVVLSDWTIIDEHRNLEIRDCFEGVSLRYLQRIIEDSLTWPVLTVRLSREVYQL